MASSVRLEPVSHLPLPCIALAAAAALSVVPAGCAMPHTLSWELGWSDTVLEDRAVAVEASILEGGCEGTVLWTTQIELGHETEDPPKLGEGRYGFRARARDMSCIWFADGCRDLELPAEDASSDVRVVLAGATELAACAADLCIAGLCACTAPGQCGTACVGADCDCVFGDCALRCTEDGSCSCTGGGCRMRCDEGSVCDCLGGGCVMDCGPETTCECLSGGCVYSCGAGASCTCQGGGCR